MQKLLFIIPLFFFALLSAQAQEPKIVEWVVYTEHASLPTKGRQALPELTYASESIEAEGEVTINTGSAATFRTSPQGEISLMGHFQVEKGAFFRAHKGQPEAEVVETTPAEEQFETRNPAITTAPELSVMRAYPNPFSDYLQIDLILETDSQLEIALYDATGKLVKEIVREKHLPAGRHQAKINTSGLVPGMYFCEVLTDSQQFRKTVVCTE
ncbi:T9SS type A sorting domain-containing protein [Flavilitoribacter nigricans]|nr:T9SS type A sorting domain-containing protein [Flavilitoribacter nigricans]